MSHRLCRLREQGFQILIDDFGTGYSSLSRLHRFPIDGLKNDQSFIRPMLFDGDSAAIVRTIVALGKALNLNLYAEGVEEEGAAIALSHLRCEFAQGYLFAKPLPLEKSDALIGEMLLIPAEPRSR